MCNSCNPQMMSFMRSYVGRRDFLKFAAGSVAFGLGGNAPAMAETATADRIFLSRTILTMNAAAPNADAIAVKGGRIIAVGKREDVLSLKGPQTDVRDFGDYPVLPGFIDPHMHSNFSGLRPWLDVGPFTTADLDAARTKIKQAASTAKSGGWVQAKMLDPSIMPGKEFSRADLDALSPDVPVFVLESNGHVAYVNSAALRLGKVTRDLPDPPQGRFGRDAAGELNGRLEEPPAFQPFVTVMPSPSTAEFANLLRADFEEAVSRGCTALHDCGIGTLFAEGDLHLIDTVMAENAPLRYAGFLVSTHFAKWQEMGLKPGMRSEKFKLTGIKAWADGSNQGGTGFQREPYLASSSRGALNYTGEEIEKVIREAHDAGWQVGVHANGDAAIDVVLQAFKAALAGSDGRTLRHWIEHCSLLHDEQIEIMASLGISPSFLIGHVHYWGKAFQQRILGPDRASMLDRCRSAIDKGLRISLHSDYNVTPIDPLRCIQNAVVRDMREGGGVLNEAERITPLEAIRAMTIDAAWQCQLDDLCGSLEIGKAADIVVLEQDPTKVDPQAIEKIKVHSTWLDGESRFAA